MHLLHTVCEQAFKCYYASKQDISMLPCAGMLPAMETRKNTLTLIHGSGTTVSDYQFDFSLTLSVWQFIFITRPACARTYQDRGLGKHHTVQITLLSLRSCHRLSSTSSSRSASCPTSAPTSSRICNQNGSCDIQFLFFSFKKNMSSK
jgi:hypothetical protein